MIAAKEAMTPVQQPMSIERRAFGFSIHHATSALVNMEMAMSNSLCRGNIHKHNTRDATMKRKDRDDLSCPAAEAGKVQVPQPGKRVQQYGRR
ncbi:hypothetical protein [Xanthomonas vesicatoria]|uniref:Uncharacterized protein n=1 Tax=Xanthomonas vesicatoria TaxID=56460 RepID=A0ABS8LEV8_9XANT|nr:hypothetical protein [Xanthomonas vesicatoria]MCC8619347.1 hypothetical protein [Xanthomonas vesicatoria]MCC8624183.1 hypothetical protein [Xanthomonas vesicatoria]MCC8631787.1 hypothetical protein [Xanthomonas vesicatoria]MCC8696099.1 hypothetical protein [Xanthomonas vesicatoria]MDG4488595.1 hypothetical protein [Xanthomonas vesicatoria]